MACTKPQQRKKEEYEKLRGEREQIKFIDLRFERCAKSFLASFMTQKHVPNFANPQPPIHSQILLHRTLFNSNALQTPLLQTGGIYCC